MAELIKTTLSEGIATLALDHYAKRNALSRQMVDEVLEAMEQFQEQRARVVILRSASPQKVWSAGHSVDELPKADVDPLPHDDPLERLLQTIRHCPAPVIAMVQGSVWGGACDLVMNCDLVLADETAAFAITPAKLGLPYNVSGFLSFMRRLPLVAVKEMFFTADLIDTQRAERLHIVNQIVPAAELEEKTLAMARTIASRSASAVTVAKEALRVLVEANPINPVQFEYVQSLRRNAYFGPDYHEGVKAFLEKRPPRFGQAPECGPRP